MTRTAWASAAARHVLAPDAAPDAQGDDPGERRAWSRVPLDAPGGVAILLPARVAHGAPCALLGRVCDLSPGGCCLAVPSALAWHFTPGDSCTLVFPATTHGLRQQARIVAIETPAAVPDDVRLHLRFDPDALGAQDRITLWAALAHWMLTLRRQGSAHDAA